MTDKHCKKCDQTLPTDQFYFVKSTQRGNMLTSYCKKCHNAGNYVKKGTGFAKLDKAQQDPIIAAIADRGQKLKDIAEEEGIKYHTLRYWVTKKTIPTLQN